MIRAWPRCGSRPKHVDGNLMQVRAISGRRSVRLVMEGELDIAGAPLLKDALRDIDPGAAGDPARVILDLRAVTFVDSAGAARPDRGPRRLPRGRSGDGGGARAPPRW